MFPWPQIHSRIQGQKFFFHFNPLAAQSKPCQRRQAAVSVPNESIKRWKRSSFILNTTRGPLSSVCLCLVTSSGTTNKDSTKTHYQAQTKTRYQTELDGRRVVFKVKDDLFHRFIDSFSLTLSLGRLCFTFVQFLLFQVYPVFKRVLNPTTIINISWPSELYSFQLFQTRNKNVTQSYYQRENEMNNNGQRLYTDGDGNQFSNVCWRLALPLCSVPAAWAEDTPYLNRIINPTVDLLFVTPYNVVQRVISSSINANTLRLLLTFSGAFREIFRHKRPKLSVSMADKNIRICMEIPIKSLRR